MNTLKPNRDGGRYIALRRTKKVKQDEASKIAKRLNVDITTMHTGEVIGRLYQRHSTGFWMVASLVLGVIAGITAIY